jgi:hypothetical protein
MNPLILPLVTQVGIPLLDEILGIGGPSAAQQAAMAQAAAQAAAQRAHEQNMWLLGGGMLLAAVALYAISR